eukprot:TRINITY_DN4696_c0_g1_i1.p1 TRINITY_DN4696_c0_g1~~TRINITY_DN4696_c0_g1_i1.p1  ORF type:complete len:294 (+),score=66.55 TRINITY_DN4696_c0_g1_i1:386-1267(+)
MLSSGMHGLLTTCAIVSAAHSLFLTTTTPTPPLTRTTITTDDTPSPLSSTTATTTTASPHTNINIHNSNINDDNAEFDITSPLFVWVVVVILWTLSVALACLSFLEKKGEQVLFAHEWKREEWECDNYLEGEQHEMVQLYMSKGMSQQDAETVIGLLSKNKKMFVDIMMVEELCLMPPSHDLSPLCGAAARLVAFFVLGMAPVAALCVSVEVCCTSYQAFLALTLVTALVVGILRVYFCVDLGSWWGQGLLHLLLVAVTVGVVHGAVVLLQTTTPWGTSVLAYTVSGIASTST